jgi:hypothetical protein
MILSEAAHVWGTVSEQHGFKRVNHEISYRRANHIDLITNSLPSVVKALCCANGITHDKVSYQ